MDNHGLTFDKDEDGWDFASCSCGWVSPPCPDTEIAADFYGDHRAASAVAVTANVVKVNLPECRCSCNPCSFCDVATRRR